MIDVEQGPTGNRWLFTGFNGAKFKEGAIYRGVHRSKETHKGWGSLQSRVFDLEDGRGESKECVMVTGESCHLGSGP